MQHLLGIRHLDAATIERCVESGLAAKASRRRAAFGVGPLAGQSWAMIFSKASTRTRVSFEVGIRELGGAAMYLSAREMQLGRGEPVCDTARVLGRMVHGAVIRTYQQSEVEEFAAWSGIPTINALTDEEHPCQVLADLMTMQERLGGWTGRKVAFLGDGNNNMARSWMWAAARLGFPLVVAAPAVCQPEPVFVEGLGSDWVTVTDDPRSAAEDASVLYTDVWVSMGQEDKAAEGREAELARFCLNARLVALARPDVLVQHCLPAYRDKEITTDVLEAHADAIFAQAENRLHLQKGVLEMLGGRE